MELYSYLKECMQYAELDKEVEEQIRKNINLFAFSYTIFLMYEKIIKGFQFINQFYDNFLFILLEIDKFYQ